MIKEKEIEIDEVEDQDDSEDEKPTPKSDPKLQARTMAYTTLLRQLLGADQREVEALIDGFGGVTKVATLINGGKSEEIDNNLNSMRTWLKRMREKGKKKGK